MGRPQVKAGIVVEHFLLGEDAVVRGIHDVFRQHRLRVSLVLDAVFRDLILGHGLLGRAASVAAWAVRAVGNVEAQVDADNCIHVDDDDLDGEVDNVEGGFGEGRGHWLSARHWVVPAGVGAVARTDADEGGCGEQNDNLLAEAAVAELVELHAPGPRQQNRDEGQRDREERHKSEIGDTVELNVAIDAAGVLVERVEGLNHCGDEHGDADDDEGEARFDKGRKYWVPADMRLRSPEDALGKDEVDDEEDDDTSIEEDLGCDCDADVVRQADAGDAHHHCRDPSHAET